MVNAYANLHINMQQALTMNLETVGNALYGGIAGIKVADAGIDLNHGCRLDSTYLQVQSKTKLVFNKIDADDLHEPLETLRSDLTFDVETQLTVGGDYVSGEKRLDAAKVVTNLLRLMCNPKARLAITSDIPFCDLEKCDQAAASGEELNPMHLRLYAEPQKLNRPESFQWISAHWRDAFELTESSAAFRLAVDVFELGQFAPTQSMALVSLWGALESIFSPHNAELKFRVSAYIAAYLEKPGPKRLELQKHVAELYNKRSSAAHGNSKHQLSDLIDTFSLLRRAIITMIERKEVPDEQYLNELLFGVR